MCDSLFGSFYCNIFQCNYEPFLSQHLVFMNLLIPLQLFEGLKVHRGDDGKLRFFRPMLNMKRMAKSAKRACLPVRLKD